MDTSKSILDVKAAEAMATSVDVLLCCFLLIALFMAYLTKEVPLHLFAGISVGNAFGLGFGVVSKMFFDGRHLRFDPQVFFYGLLPIIIFNAAYSLKKKSKGDPNGTLSCGSEAKGGKM